MIGIQWLTAARISVLINQGEQNQAALEKGQRKNMCISSSVLPHLEQFSFMCLENLLALLPVGSALLRSLQANVCTRGAMSLSCQT
uniref:Uncharacterized protein n=1 Tax=Triticum urartu TaxID=4572 RepID=A0A8R7USW3_TRIUA